MSACKLACTCSEHGRLYIALSTHSDEEVFKAGEPFGWFESQLPRQKHIVSKRRMPIERKVGGVNSDI
jgi:hypothetical protein